MAKERLPRSRAPYNFTPETKSQVYDEQDGQCIVSGREYELECHHMLFVAAARGFWPNIDPEILKQRENAVYLNREVHEKLHEQVHKWPKEFFRLYMVGLYSYLRDYYEENKETVIYTAVGD